MTDYNDIYIVEMPLFIMTGKRVKKKNTINLNYYGGWHRNHRAKVKRLYHELAKERLEAAGVPFMNQCSLEFTLYKKNRVQKDKANFLSLQEKFFCDPRTEAGLLVDDTDDQIIELHYHKSVIDKEDPRVVIKITHLN